MYDGVQTELYRCMTITYGAFTISRGIDFQMELLEGVIGCGRCGMTYQEVVAEAITLHQGSVEDVGVGGGAEVIVDVIAAGRGGGTGGRWILGMGWRVDANSDHKAAS
jgi:hypothetical protein